MKKEKRVRIEPPLPRFKQGVGVASWKLAAALLIGLLLGIGGGIAKSNVTAHKQALSDYQLGLEVGDPSPRTEG